MRPELGCDHFGNPQGFRNPLAIPTSDSKDLSGFVAAHSRNLNGHPSIRYFETEAIDFRFWISIAIGRSLSVDGPSGDGDHWQIDSV